MEKFSLYQIEHISNDAFRVKKSYVDICDGDLNAGILLGQIIYWFLPDKKGQSKLRVTYYGKRALAKARTDWIDEIRMTAKQYDRAVKKLQAKGYVVVENSMFDSKRTPFIMLNEDAVTTALYELTVSTTSVCTIEEERYSPKGNTDNDHTVIPLTETTTKTTTKIKKISIDDSINGIVRRYADKFREHTANEHFHLTEDQMDEVEHNIQHAQNEMGIDDEDMMDIVDHHFRVMPIDNDGHIKFFASGDGLTGVIRRYAQDLDLY